MHFLLCWPDENCWGEKERKKEDIFKAKGFVLVCLCARVCVDSYTDGKKKSLKSYTLAS